MSTRVDAFLDGDHFYVMCPAGHRPLDAVTAHLSRKLGAAVTMWPVEPTPSGEMFRAQWFDVQADVFTEAKVEIWNASRRTT